MSYEYEAVPDRITGEPLDPMTARELGDRFGQDFSTVRVHTGPDTGRSAAYTVGEDIVFAPGRYAPRTAEGRRLITHELAHVVQQRTEGPHRTDQWTGPDGVRAAPVDDADEAYAHRAAAQVAAGRRPEPPAAGRRAGPRAQRSPDVPAAPRREDVAQELPELQFRLATARAREEATRTSGPDVPVLEEELAWKSQLAAEPDVTKQRIIFLRARLRQLRQRLRAAAPAEREGLRDEVHAHETALGRALDENVARLGTYALRLRALLGTSGDPGLTTLLATVETELLDNQADLAYLRRVFKPATAPAVAEKYRKEVRPLPGGGCMTAVYKGLESLYTPQTSADVKQQVQTDAARVLRETKQDTNTCDRIMETLRSRGLAGSVNQVRFDQRRGAWVPTVEKTVLNLVSADYPGWYFFGLSVSGAYHSVILAVDNADGGTPKIYWMDQFSKGFTKDVTGRLDAAIKEYRPGYGYADCKVWALLPTPDTVLPIP
ncbi:DUF4157 domain-containing protein [Dactylosporangium roseum]